MPPHFPSNEEIVASLKQSSIELKKRQKAIKEIEKGIERATRQLDSIDWSFYSSYDAPFLIQHCRKYGKKANPVVFDVLRKEYGIQRKQLSLLIKSNMDFTSLEHINAFLHRTKYTILSNLNRPFSFFYQNTHRNPSSFNRGFVGQNRVSATRFTLDENQCSHNLSQSSVTKTRKK